MTALGKVPLLLLGLALLAGSTWAAAITTTEDDGLTSTTTDAVTELTTTEDDESGEGTEETKVEKDWRDNTLIYQIWPRSFQDSDGDGEGDLQGIISRLDYLAEIGVDTIRLSSIYSSPQIDAGFDILNHTDIDPIFGDFDDFEELVKEAHNKSLKIILDIIPNHSSDQHEWFIASAAEKEPYDDYYIWADGKYEDNRLLPPNKWKSEYSDDDGSAWTWHTGKRKWYYHKFHHTEPDLNLRNEDVVQEILDIFDFWLEKDVDGFCIVGVSYLFEDEALLDDSSKEKGNDKNDDDDDDGDDDDDDDDDDADDNTVGEGNAGLLYRFRAHIDKWVEDNNEEPKLLIGEVDEDDDEIISYYGNDTDPGIIPLNLNFITKLNDTSDADDVRDLIVEYMQSLPEDAESNWMLSNQDYSRAASRLDPDLMDGLYMLTMLLPGQAIIYYGEEIGMLNTNISWDDTIDIKALGNSEDDYDEFSRDPYRTPMQWDNSTSAGFSTNETTFLPVNPNYEEINVKKQSNHENSNLKAFKILATLREDPIFTQGDHELAAVNDDDVLILKRSLYNDTCLVIINFGSDEEKVNLTALYPDLEEDLQVMVDSSNADVEKENDEDKDGDIENDLFTLAPKASVVLCDRDDFAEFSIETTTDGEDSDEDESDESDNLTSTTTEEPPEPVTVVPVSSTEPPPEPSSANKQHMLEFVVILQFALLLLLRTL